MDTPSSTAHGDVSIEKITFEKEGFFQRWIVPKTDGISSIIILGFSLDNIILHLRNVIPLSLSYTLLAQENSFFSFQEGCSLLIYLFQYQNDFKLCINISFCLN